MPVAHVKCQACTPDCYYFFGPLLQAVMPSPLVELRNSNMKRHEISFLEDYAFQQTTPTVSALRDPVCNRVTLVRLCGCAC